MEKLLCLIALAMLTMACNCKPDVPAKEEPTAGEASAEKAPGTTKTPEGLGQPAFREVAATWVASVHNKGPYEGLGKAIGTAYGWLGKNGISPLGPPLMIYWTDPMNVRDSADYFTEIRIPIPAPEDPDGLSDSVVKLKEVQAHTIAVQKELGAPDKVAAKYDGLAKWLAEQDKQVVGAAQMVSHSNPMTTPAEQQIHELSYTVVDAVAPDPAVLAEVKAVADEFWKACAVEDWDTAAKAGRNYLEDEKIAPQIKKLMGGVEIIELGDPVKDRTKGYPGFFVPYKIKRKDGVVDDHRLAIRNDGPDGKWFIDGGL